MKRKVISALLACTLLAGSAVPALAAGETAAGQTPAGIGAEAPALKVRQMGVLAVKKAVQEDNSTVRILRKNASAIEDAAGGSSFGSASVSPGATYSELADTLEKILETGTLDGDTKKAYEAQITALRGNAENMNLSVSVSVSERARDALAARRSGLPAAPTGGQHRQSDGDGGAEPAVYDGNAGLPDGEPEKRHRDPSTAISR